jgi:hypothetical protein
MSLSPWAPRGRLSQASDRIDTGRIEEVLTDFFFFSFFSFLGALAPPGAFVAARLGGVASGEGVGAGAARGQSSANSTLC